MAVVGACREGAYREGACREGACREGACCKEGGIGGRVAVVGVCREGACGEGACREGACSKEGGISGRVDIGASSGKDAFRSFRVPLLLYRVLSVVYNGGVGK